MSKSKLDETDLEVLAELDLNARATNSNIGRKLGINNKAVRNHIKKLEEIGVIKGYVPAFDLFRLGFQSYRLNLKFQHVNTTIEKEIVDYLSSLSSTWWCCRARGRFDLCALFWVRDLAQLWDLWNGFRLEYRPYIKIAVIVPHYKMTYCTFPFTKQIYKEEAKDAIIGARGLLKIDEKDRSILRILSSDARAPLQEIGKSIGLTPAAVGYRIDQLFKKKVIVSLKPLVDMSKLGYTSYKVDINLSSLKNQKKIEQNILENANTSHLVSTIGGADIEMKAFVKKADELNEIMDNIKDEFSDDLQDYNLLEYPEPAKEFFVPDF